jgi:predicted metal-dependent hydrolase
LPSYRKVFKGEKEENRKNSLFFPLDCEKVIVEVLEKTKAVESFARNGIDLKGDLVYDRDYVYVLGKRLKVTCDLSKAREEGYFYAKNFDSLGKVYNELALANFKKRILAYKSLMGIQKDLEVGLSDAVRYLGLNNLRKNCILLNYSLYGFNPEVGDAVLVHELAHCFEANHQKAFYDIVLKYCPGYYRYEKMIISGDFEGK